MRYSPLKGLWPWFDLKGNPRSKVTRSTERSYMTLYMYFIQTLVTACTVSEILAQIDNKGLNWTFLTLKITFNNQSTPLKFENSTRITSEKPYEAIHLGSTSILLINIEKYVKMSQTGPFCPWQGPLEWFNQILLFTVHHHHPGEASCQIREKVTEQILNKWTINVKIGEKWQL